VIFWSGRTSMQAGGQRAGRDVHLTYDDARVIQQECRSVQHVTVELASAQPAHSRFNSGIFSTHGITPVYQQIRSMNLDAGRSISEAGLEAGRAVCVLGEEVQKQLFAGGAAVGEQLFIRDLPFTVIAVLSKKNQ